MDFNLFLKARFLTVIKESFKTLFETVIQMRINDFYRINEQFFNLLHIQIIFLGKIENQTTITQKTG